VDMDALALEATSTKKPANAAGEAVAPGPAQAPVKRKPAKKAKKAVVFFEVEILDAKTKDKLCFLDKVRTLFILFSCVCISLHFSFSFIFFIFIFYICKCFFRIPVREHASVASVLFTKCSRCSVSGPILQ